MFKNLIKAKKTKLGVTLKARVFLEDIFSLTYIISVALVNRLSITSHTCSSQQLLAGLTL